MVVMVLYIFSVFKQKTAYEMRISDWSSDVCSSDLPESGAIDHVVTAEHGVLAADLYIDCSGFRAELIGGALQSPFRGVKHQLFTDRALACKLPSDRPDVPIESYTIAAAHEAGWTWDIGLAGGRGIGCVYSSDHLSDERAGELLAVEPRGRPEAGSAGKEGDRKG